MTRHDRTRLDARPARQSRYQVLSYTPPRCWQRLWRDILPTLLMLGLVAGLCLQLGNSIDQARQQHNRVLPLSMGR